MTGDDVIVWFLGAVAVLTLVYVTWPVLKETRFAYWLYVRWVWRGRKRR